ncbi:hypothetical protein ABW19_dt0205880 [Dactylella cylindrospora]|nr:hypothetical protein ABW19_dt0205880 [Dactylella cylindrospora]
MSTTLPLNTFRNAAGAGRSSTLVSISQQRLSGLSICSNCLRSIWGPLVQTRGKKTLPKATGIKVRLLKDIPEYGPKGSIMMVAPGRMRSIWYQRGEAEYLTRELEKSIGKYILVERDPAYRPVAARKLVAGEAVNAFGEYVPETVREKLLTSTDTVAILNTTLPPTIRFFRATISPTSSDIHGSVTTADIASAIKMITIASQHPDGNRVVVTPENIKFVHDPDSHRVKHLGEWEIDIEYRGEPAIRRSVSISRDDDDESEEIVSQQPSVDPVPPQPTGSIFGSSKQEV